LLAVTLRASSNPWKRKGWGRIRGALGARATDDASISCLPPPDDSAQHQTASDGTTDKRGVSALLLQRQLGIRRYEKGSRSNVGAEEGTR